MTIPGASSVKRSCKRRGRYRVKMDKLTSLWSMETLENLPELLNEGAGIAELIPSQPCQSLLMPHRYCRPRGYLSSVRIFVS